VTRHDAVALRFAALAACLKRPDRPGLVISRQSLGIGLRSALLRRTLETRLMSVNDPKADISVSSCDFRHASSPAELGAL
jgi:hypothetical protein